MRINQLVAIAIRILSIVLGLYAIRNSFSLVPAYYEQGFETVSYYYAGVMVTFIIAAVFLWKFPLTIANYIIPHESEEPYSISINAQQFQVAGFAILGLYFLFYVISDLVYWGVMLFISARETDTTVSFTPDQKGGMVATVFEFIFVLFLLFGGKGISRLLNRIRYGASS